MTESPTDSAAPTDSPEPLAAEPLAETCTIDDFAKIDLRNNKQITHQDLEQYFTEFSNSACKILLSEIDLNQDGIITRNEWIGYWEYLRRAGYKPFVLKKEPPIGVYSSPHHTI